MTLQNILMKITKYAPSTLFSRRVIGLLGLENFRSHLLSLVAEKYRIASQFLVAVSRVNLAEKLVPSSGTSELDEMSYVSRFLALDLNRSISPMGNHI